MLSWPFRPVGSIQRGCISLLRRWHLTGINSLLRRTFIINPIESRTENPGLPVRLRKRDSPQCLRIVWAIFGGLKGHGAFMAVQAVAGTQRGCANLFLPKTRPFQQLSPGPTTADIARSQDRPIQIHLCDLCDLRVKIQVTRDDPRRGRLYEPAIGALASGCLLLELES